MARLSIEQKIKNCAEGISKGQIGVFKKYLQASRYAFQMNASDILDTGETLMTTAVKRLNQHSLLKHYIDNKNIADITEQKQDEPSRHLKHQKWQQQYLDKAGKKDKQTASRVWRKEQKEMTTTSANEEKKIGIYKQMIQDLLSAGVSTSSPNAYYETPLKLLKKNPDFTKRKDNSVTAFLNDRQNNIVLKRDISP